MPRFLDTIGMGSLAIAVCDRCKMKRAFSVLMADFNVPGLRVCDQGCLDQKDPYRLAARKTERINLRFPRPDLSVAVVPNAIVTGGISSYDLSPAQNTQTPENNGNLDTLSPSPSE
jgi:hypothetical protein